MKSVKPKNLKLITLMEAFLILAPLLLLFFILLFDGQPEAIFDKPEWSFVTVFYLIEVLRDQVSRNQLGGYHLEQTEAGVVFYAIILILGVFILNMDFKYSIGESLFPIKAIYIMKFSAFGGALILYVVHRYKKYKLISKLDIT